MLINRLDFGVKTVTVVLAGFRHKYPKRYSAFLSFIRLTARNPMSCGFVFSGLVFLFYYLMPGFIFRLQNPNSSTIYWRDSTHLAYSLAMVSSGIPFVMAILKASPTFRATRKLLDDQEIKSWDGRFSTNLRWTFSWPVMLLCLVSSLGTFVILMNRAADPRYIYWWGAVRFGWAGTYFAFIASQMVFWGLLGSIFVVACAHVVSTLARRRLKYDPVNPDMTSGLRPIGNLLLEFWWFAISLSFGVYLVFTWGYLELAKNPLIWLVALVASSLLPLMILAPILSVARSVESAKYRFLHKLRSAHSQADREQQTCLLEILNIQDAVARQGILPFKARAFFVLFVFNGIQFFAAARELMSK